MSTWDKFRAPAREGERERETDFFFVSLGLYISGLEKIRSFSKMTNDFCRLLQALVGFTSLWSCTQQSSTVGRGGGEC